MRAMTSARFSGLMSAEMRQVPTCSIAAVLVLVAPALVPLLAPPMVGTAVVGSWNDKRSLLTLTKRSLVNVATECFDVCSKSSQTHSHHSSTWFNDRVPSMRMES